MLLLRLLCRVRGDIARVHMIRGSFLSLRVLLWLLLLCTLLLKCCLHRHKRLLLLDFLLHFLFALDEFGGFESEAVGGFLKDSFRL